ncbi:MAG: PKD domain-containing protein [Candidatus Thermoplasmatota archaeon]|nr:PKD domain-containing protein [Candidatus Thermoplasmatota archaeon]
MNLRKINHKTGNLLRIKPSLWIVSCLLLMASIIPVLQANRLGDEQTTANTTYSSPYSYRDVIELTQSVIKKKNTIDSSKNDEWMKTHGGSNIDVGYCVQQTTDGGYIISGYTRSYGANGHNIWLIKTDSSGNELWNNTFGGSNDDEGESVQQTTDGGYIITGWTKSYGSGGKDLWLIKTDSQGDEEWNKIFGGAYDDGGTTVQQITDGGYVISGYTSSYGTGSVDAWLIKTDELGNQEWNKTLGGYSSDGAWCVQQTTDGGYVLTGWTFSSGPGYVGNAWLVKTDNEGNQQWSHAFGGDDVDRGYHVQQTTDSGFIITGYTSSFGAGLDDVLLIKTDSSGNEQWIKTFGGTGRDYGYCVEQTIDGGYIITGYTLSYGAGGDDVWLIKTNAEGEKRWDRTYGGVNSDVGYHVQQTTDTGYIITGHTLSYGAGLHDVWLIKIQGNESLPLGVDAGGPYNGFVGATINFTGTVTGGVAPFIYHWDFGDNTTSNEQSPSHVYSTEGDYQAVFTVIDDAGTQENDTATVTILAYDTTPPDLTITSPQNQSLYLGGKRLVPFPITLVIGRIQVTINTSDEDSGISSVIFSLNDVEQKTITTPPYIWDWTERAFGRFSLEVEAIDGAGNKATDQITVWKLF